MNEYNYLENSIAVSPMVEDRHSITQQLHIQIYLVKKQTHKQALTHELDIQCHFLCNVKKLEMT